MLFMFVVRHMGNGVNMIFAVFLILTVHLMCTLTIEPFVGHFDFVLAFSIFCDYLYSIMKKIFAGFAADSAHPKFKELQRIVMQSAPDTGLLAPVADATGLF